MLTLNIYMLFSLILSSYSYYTLYQKENQFFLFFIYILKSKYYFCISLNLCLISLIVIGKLIIKILFNEIRVSEMLVKIFFAFFKYFFAFFKYFFAFFDYFFLWFLNIWIFPPASNRKTSNEIFKLFFPYIDIKTLNGHFKNFNNSILHRNAYSKLFNFQKIKLRKKLKEKKQKNLTKKNNKNSTKNLQKF